MSLIASITDAVAAALNHAAPGTFAQGFTAQRYYRPLFDLEDLKSLKVSVVPRGIEVTSLGRNANQHDVSIDVAVQQKIAVDDMATLDSLMELVERIADYFRLRRLETFQQAIWTKSENVPVFSPEHLEQKQVFTSVLTLTFRVVR
jgi:hypothetical protein